MQSYFQYGILSVWKIMSDDYMENLHFFLKLQLECFSFLSCMGKIIFECFFFPRFQHNAWYMVDAQYICWMIENKKQHQTISDINVSKETVFNSILKGSGLPKNLLLIWVAIFSYHVFTTCQYCTTVHLCTFTDQKWTTFWRKVVNTLLTRV